MARGYTKEDDPYYIPNPEKHLHYRFITCSDSNRMSRHLTPRGKRAAYTIVRGKTVEETKEIARKLGLSETMVQEARNWIQYMTSVLASLPRAEYDLRIREQIQEQKDLAGDSDEQFYARFDGVRGVKPVKREIEEWDDRKEHAASSKAFLSMSTVSR